MRIQCTALLVAIGLSACSAATDPAPGPADAPLPAAIDQAAAPVAMPSPAPDAAQPDAARFGDAMASFTGYGDLQLGTTAADLRYAWGGDLQGSASEPGGCHYLLPAWVASSREIGFMVEGDRFVRYDVGIDTTAAPGGGRVGMDVAELQTLYGNALQSGPHEYVPGGQTLAIDGSGVAPTRLVFETDAEGRATSWRVGLSPQVNYAEGCS